MIKTLSDLYALKHRFILKPIFFLLDPEFIHDQHVNLGKLAGSQPILKKILELIFSYQNPKLVKKIDGIRFPNPVGLSAGFDYNGDLTQALPSIGFGFHTIGTVTFNSYQGNPKPRLGRLPNSKSLIVNKGLKNIGVKNIIKKLEGKRFAIPVGFSVASTNKSFNSTKDQIIDILKSFQLLEESNLSHSYYELNISCPNTFGGEPFTTPDRLQILLKALDKIGISKPIYIKMPVDLTDKEALQLLKVINDHNIQGVIMGNLTKDKKNPDVKKEDLEIWKKTKGNLSGKPTWNRSNNLIKLTKKHYPTRFTIIGTGGIFSGEDAREKIRLGADLVQLITGMIYQGPQLIGQINYYLAKT